jgi:predicted transcriptional regulator
MARQKNLGDLEQQVMNFLWQHGPATSDAVRAAVGKDKPLTDSTIRTVLRRLEAKQYVRHEAAPCSRGSRKDAYQEFLPRLFGRTLNRIGRSSCDRQC